MKQTENNEIDVLLRDLARRDNTRAFMPEGLAGMHLDVDELNSYAEQTLPSAARARYTSHLAECASCRRIVSELTSASGANVREHAVSQKSSAGLRQRLGTLFSPSVLRFAAPAFALFAFIAVGLVVLRQKPQPDFVAQNQPAVSRDAAIETKTPAPSAERGTAPGEVGEGAIDDQRRPGSQSNVANVRDNQAKTNETSATSNIATATESVTIASDKDASKGKAAEVVASPSYAPEPNAPPAPKPQITHTESRTEVAGRQKEAADKKDEPAREQEGARARRDDNQDQVARPATGTGAVAGQSQERLHKLEAKRGSLAGAKTNDDEADTRTISGRRFRRQAGVWIDSAYQSSTATTNLTRGSEQFRALVADEPGIRVIAAQLAGEVIVVWKGRAYRIR